MKKILAVLVNYGEEQLNYLQQVVTELKSFQKYNVTVIVNSNIPLNQINGIDNLNVIKFKEHHVDKYLEYNKILPKNRITGLIQYEENETGKYYPAYHAHYKWDNNSVEEYGNKKFAHFTNIHQATFILTKEQLLDIGKKHDFTKFFGSSQYSVKCKVNTDIYQFCDMKKLICISEFEDNLIHHLPNIYINGENGRSKLGHNHTHMLNSIKEIL